jgi:hypothetical protein
MDLTLHENLTISDTDLAKDQGRMRALIAMRLEALWAGCAPFIEARSDPETGIVFKPDPRFLETGLRVLRDLGRLYRIDAPAQQDPGAGQVPVSDRVIVARQLQELEDKVTGARQD